MPNEQKIEISQGFFKKIITEKLIIIDSKLEQVHMTCMADNSPGNTIIFLRDARNTIEDLIEAIGYKDV